MSNPRKHSPACECLCLSLLCPPLLYPLWLYPSKDAFATAVPSLTASRKWPDRKGAPRPPGGALTGQPRNLNCSQSPTSARDVAAWPWLVRISRRTRSGGSQFRSVEDFHASPLYLYLWRSIGRASPRRAARRSIALRGINLWPSMRFENSQRCKSAYGCT
jgi:hypothetical protein